MSFYRTLCGLALVAVAVVCIGGGQALGETLFADNFDDGTVGAYPDSPQVGSWDPGATYPAVVASLDTPAPVSEPNVLNCPAGGISHAWGVASRDSLPGEAVHLEFQLHQDNVPHCSPHIGLWLPDTPVGEGFFAQAVTLIGMNNTGTTQTVWYNDGGWHDSFVTYHPNIWEKFEMDYVSGASTYDLTVSSAEYGSETVTLNVRTAGTVHGIATRSGDGWVGTYRFDDILLTGAVPEPGALVLLLGVLAGLLVIRRK